VCKYSLGLYCTNEQQCCNVYRGSNRDMHVRQLC
jgi:hypothetical protein